MIKKQLSFIILIITFLNQFSFSQVHAEIEIEVSPDIPTHKETNSQLIIKKESAFIQTLISGKKPLYYYKPKGSKGNFYIKTDKGIELLKHKKYILITDAGYMLKNKNIYIAQLNDYFKDCPEITKNTQKLNYKKTDLLSIFDDYHTCIHTNIPINKDVKEVKFEFGLLLGISATKLNFEGDPSVFSLVQADFKESYKPTGGFYVDALSSKNNRWSSYNEFLFSSYSVKGNYSFVNSSNNLIERTNSISRSYLNFNSLIRYKIPIGSAFIFINGGLSFGLVINSKNAERYLKPFDDVLTRKIERSLIFGTGIKYKKINFSLRVESGNGVSKNDSISSKSYRFSFLGGYRF